MFICSLCDRPRHHRDHGYFSTPAGEVCEECYQEMAEEYDAATDAAIEEAEAEGEHYNALAEMAEWEISHEGYEGLLPRCDDCGRLLTPDTGFVKDALGVVRCHICYRHGLVKY